MREKLGVLLVGATACLALIAAGPAFGATYCVHQAGTCAAGQVDEGGSLQQALTDASGADSAVLVGPGTYTHNNGFSVSTSHLLTITGAGRGQTVLRATGSGDVLTLTGSMASVSGVTLVVDSHSDMGLALSGGTASDIENVLDPTAPTNATGAFATGSATIRDSTLRGAKGNSFGAGVQIGSGTNTIDHDVLNADTGVRDQGSAVILERSTITDAIIGILVNGTSADLTADDNVVALGSDGTNAIDVMQGGSATVRSATLYSTADTGKAVFAESTAGGQHTTIDVLDSIAWQLPGGFAATASGGGTTAISGDYLDFDGGASGGTNASNDLGPHIVKSDPLFADAAAGDFRLRFGSPAIDAGGACAMTCQTVLDVAGVTRPVDGNGDGVATRDLGAYEYARQAPVAAASVDRTSALTGELLAFSGTGSSDPDPGDALTYSWSFDDGSASSGQDVTHAFPTAGSHTATLTVTDPTGLTATAAATVAVAAPPVLLPDTTAPSLSKVSLSPSTFTVANGSTAVSAKHHRGTRIRFTLSEAAKVVATLERRTTGVRSGKHCVAKSRKHRHGKACTRYAAAGSLTRRSEPAGADGIAFTGRVGRHRLAHGHYRMRLRATDAAGNRSKEKTATFHVV